MQKQQEAYVAPELTFVGGVDQVVLGLGGVGPDLGGEWLVPDMEFLAD